MNDLLLINAFREEEEDGHTRSGCFHMQIQPFYEMTIIDSIYIFLLISSLPSELISTNVTISCVAADGLKYSNIIQYLANVASRCKNRPVIKKYQVCRKGRFLISKV